MLGFPIPVSLHCIAATSSHSVEPPVHVLAADNLQHTNPSCGAQQTVRLSSAPSIGSIDVGFTCVKKIEALLRSWCFQGYEADHIAAQFVGLARLAAD